ncbi:carboxypeptidase-like regulatory domain-containing protein [Pseudomarimonas arenosa]|uniref:Carboxypeptidase family protein n=1 Tax=Pseudomarimonas arenosa TaxID=2774145 RepID=A0AAW3ZEV5_9GAMM|nr:carboxypeptidase-like regulatory domain-containing protein [Pseudomarimonas arenosa]MBD8524453.1 hypothetical protein [Pseudomarimonas arenosa]
MRRLNGAWAIGTCLWAFAGAALCNTDLELERSFETAIAAAERPSGRMPNAVRKGAGTGVISGIVRDAGTTMPIAGTTVVLHKFAAGQSNPSGFISQATDPDGRFEYAGLEPGYYFVSALGRDDLSRQRNFQPQIYPGVACDSACANLADGQVLSIGLGQDPADLQINLQPGASIAGRLTAQGDARIRHALIVAYDTAKRAVANEIVSAGTVDGQQILDFHLGGLPAGSYYVAVRARSAGSNYVFAARSLTDDSCGLGTCMQPSDALALADQEQRSGVDLTLSDWPTPGPDLGVAVADGSAEDLAVNIISLFDADGDLVGWTQQQLVQGGTPGYVMTWPAYQFFTVPSDWRASVVSPFRFTIEGGRSYRSRVFPDIDCGPEDCDVTAGSTPGPSFVATLTPAGSIRGSVSDHLLRRTLPGVDVVVFDSNGLRVGAGRTTDDGSYLVTGLADGEYRVATRNIYGLDDRAWPDKRCQGVCTGLEGRTVTVDGAEDVLGIDLTLNTGFFVDSFENE